MLQKFIVLEDGKLKMKLFDRNEMSTKLVEGWDKTLIRNALGFTAYWVKPNDEFSKKLEPEKPKEITIDIKEARAKAKRKKK